MVHSVEANKNRYIHHAVHSVIGRLSCCSWGADRKAVFIGGAGCSAVSYRTPIGRHLILCLSQTLSCSVFIRLVAILYGTSAGPGVLARYTAHVIEYSWSLCLYMGAIDIALCRLTSFCFSDIQHISNCTISFFCIQYILLTYFRPRIIYWAAKE